MVSILSPVSGIYFMVFYACHALLKRISTQLGPVVQADVKSVPSPRLTIIRPAQNPLAHQGKKNPVPSVMTSPSPGIRMVPP